MVSLLTLFPIFYTNIILVDISCCKNYYLLFFLTVYHEVKYCSWSTWHAEKNKRTALLKSSSLILFYNWGSIIIVNKWYCVIQCVNWISFSWYDHFANCLWNFGIFWPFCFGGVVQCCYNCQYTFSISVKPADLINAML